jgi:hypothetical protein
MSYWGRCWSFGQYLLTIGWRSLWCQRQDGAYMAGSGGSGGARRVSLPSHGVYNGTRRDRFRMRRLVLLMMMRSGPVVVGARIIPKGSALLLLVLGKSKFDIGAIDIVSIQCFLESRWCLVDAKGTVVEGCRKRVEDDGLEPDLGNHTHICPHEHTHTYNFPISLRNVVLPVSSHR